MQEIVNEITKRKKTGIRLIVCIFGSPGSGKSTFAENLHNELKKTHGLKSEIVPMDGFHFDNEILAARGLLGFKGSPATFDTDGFISLISKLRQQPETDQAIPIFDRELDLSRGSARLIEKSTNILLIEGNYLMLDQAPWNYLQTFFDLTIKIVSDQKTLKERLLRRWLDLGVSKERAFEKIKLNDLPNSDIVENLSIPADLYVQSTLQKPS